MIIIMQGNYDDKEEEEEKEKYESENEYDKRIERIMKKMMPESLEDEARGVIEYCLKQKGITMRVSKRVLEDIDDVILLYAKGKGYCLIGLARTRVNKNAIHQIDEDIAMLCKKHPEYLKEKMVKVVYAMQAMPDAIEEAKKRDIWLVTAKGELTEFKISQT